MKSLTAAIIKLKLSPPSDRYMRLADRGDALGFAANLRDVCPTIGARVFVGAIGPRKVRQTSSPGFVVTLRDDQEAAIAAGAGRLIADLEPEKE